jgi:transcriptional regulator with XRE-family HTH domain
MSTGNNIKKLRELRNFTQTYMAEKLNLSLSGYSKIERDGTDVSLKRLQQIAEVLETDINTILSFDEKNVFNFSHNHNANGVVQNQQVTSKEGFIKAIETLEKENDYLKKLVEKLTS